MTGRSLFTLALALGTAYRVSTGATTSTSTVLGTSTTDVDFSVSFSDLSSYIDSSSYYSYSYDPHPDYPDCSNTNPEFDTIDDGWCDTLLNVVECGWDGGDCCVCTCNLNSSNHCLSDYFCEDPSAPLYLEDIACENTTNQAPPVTTCTGYQDIWVINSTSNATALAEATLCSGGFFEVEWKGHIDVNTTIHVLNGTRLNITGVSDAMADGGGAVQIFFVHNGSLYLNNIGIVNGAGSVGGAIILAAGSELFADGVVFRSNIATNLGGAVHALSSGIKLVSTTFEGNSARNGGAMFVHDSEVIGDGNTNFDGNSVSDNGGGAVYVLSSVIELFSATFNDNSARIGGAMFVDDSELVGSGNTIFTGNRVSGNGGALYITGSSEVRWNMRAVIIETTVNNTFTSFDIPYTTSYDTTYTTWTEIEDSGETAFLNNSADGFGGAIYLDDSEIFLWGTSLLEQNKASSGGALYLKDRTTVSSEGVTIFASNEAISDGGAIGGTGGSFSDNGTTMFVNNTSGENGGAIDISDIDFFSTGNLSFSNNSAVFGGALYASQKNVGPTLIGVTFSGNIAEYGGAVFFSAVGTSSPVYYYTLHYYYYYYNDVSSSSSSSYWSTFDGCLFDGNSASSTGGAIHSVAGNDYIANSIFVGNSADIGGGMSISGTVYLFNSSFEDNKSGDGGGPAISNGGAISNLTRILFSGNGYHCPPDAFMDLNEANVDNSRYQIVCDGCDIECEGCTIEDSHTIPVCSDLLEHTDSRDGTATLETLGVDPGYWRATSTSRTILPCFYKNACKGGVTGNPQYCLKGYEGPYCAVCSQGYVRTLSHRCSECSSNTTLGAAVFGVFVALAGVLLLLFLYYMTRIERGRTTRTSTSRFRKLLAIQSLKIIIVSWQIVTQFSAVANVVYPSLYEDFLDVVALVNFDFSWLLSAGCLDVDFYVGLIAATAGPGAVLALLGVTYTIALRRNHGSEVGRRVVRRKHVNAIILIAFLVYSSASSAIFKTFSCDRLDDENIYLRTDYRIECGSSKHRAFMVYSGLMIIVYPLGIPGFFAILLFRNRTFLGNATLRTYNGELVHQSTSSLWKPYKPSVFYYEIVECVRRLLLAGILVFIYPDTAAQIAVTLAMAFIFAVVSERLNPYDSRWDGWVARIGHVMVVLTMIVALLSKVDVSDEGTQSQNMFAGILITAHIAMVLTGVTEAAVLIYSVQETDSPLPRQLRMPVLPVDSFASIRLNHGDEGFEDKTGQRTQEHE